MRPTLPSRSAIVAFALVVWVVSSCGSYTVEGHGGGGSASAGAGGGAPTCTNDAKDGSETDVDCGGPDCAPCGTGQACAEASDCASAVCVGGACVEAACDDAVKNGGETDTDCGGGSTCRRCAEGQACDAGTDCASGACTSGACERSCADGARNGPETDVDCGGTCSTCANLKKCASGNDCASGFCKAGICQDAGCGDGTKDNGESDVDCGGSACAACGAFKACSASGDCKSGVCTGGLCQPSCGDGEQNQGESDVDCGGVNCAACSALRSCTGPADCASLVCTASVCEAPTCSDGVRNQGETDEDCGGPNCGGCDNGGACLTGIDCVSGGCDAGRCGVWSKRFGDVGNEYNPLVAVDKTGNVAIAGQCSFGQSVSMGGAPITCTGGVFNTLVGAFSPTGAPLWSRGLIGALSDVAYGLTYDSQGDLLVAGMTFGGGDFSPVTGANDYAVFVIKLDGTSGAVKWLRTFDGNDHDVAWAVAVDASDDVIFGGSTVSGSLDFGGGPRTNFTAPTEVAFAAKLRGTDGAHVWSNVFSGGHSVIDSVGVGPDKDPIFAGSHVGTTNFGGTNLASPSNNSVFLVKLAGATGGHVWSWDAPTGGALYYNYVAVDAAGDALATGICSGVCSVGGPSIGDPTANSGWVAKYKGTTGAHVWSRTASLWANAWAITVDGAGNALLAGNYAASADFGTSLPPYTGGLDAFVAAYASADGAILGARFFDTPADETAQHVAVDPSSGNVLVVGTFAQGVDLGAGAMTSAGGLDWFLASLGRLP